MQHQLSDGHLRAVGLRLEVGIYRVIELHFLRLNELQDSGCGDRLAHRVGHHRRRGIQLSTSGNIRPAGGIFEHDLFRRNDEVLNPRYLRVPHQLVQVGAGSFGGKSDAFIHDRSTHERAPHRAHSL